MPGSQKSILFICIISSQSVPRDKELGENTREFLYRLYWALSAKGNLLGWEKFPMEGTGYLDVLAEPEIPLPWPWLSQQEFDYYVNEYERTGPESACIGGLNSYRIADRNWEIGADYADANIDVPCLFYFRRARPCVTDD